MAGRLELTVHRAEGGLDLLETGREALVDLASRLTPALPLGAVLLLDHLGLAGHERRQALDELRTLGRLLDALAGGVRHVGVGRVAVTVTGRGLVRGCRLVATVVAGGNEAKQGQGKAQYEGGS